MTDERSIELSIEVPGTAEEVWAAIATGPGISSWYVPHQVEERDGGAASARFGEGPGMEVPGRVASWEPPNRIVFDGGEGAGGFAFEWTVEAQDGGTCIVRLVNSGFGTGDDWDAQYDAMTDGWTMFLLNLKLHCTHFAGQAATPIIPTSMWSTGRDDAWAALTSGLGLARHPEIGSQIVVAGDGAPTLAGEVVDATPWRLSLLVSEPAPGTALIAAEGMGDQIAVSVWMYLYGDAGAAAVADGPVWQKWLDALGADAS
ncbi:MAG: SRPBCC domain-containing protein [Actinomycetota bacterium]